MFCLWCFALSVVSDFLFTDFDRQVSWNPQQSPKPHLNLQLLSDRSQSSQAQAQDTTQVCQCVSGWHNISFTWKLQLKYMLIYSIPSIFLEASVSPVPTRSADREDKWQQKPLPPSSPSSSSPLQSVRDTAQPSWMELAKRKSMAWSDNTMD